MRYRITFILLGVLSTMLMFADKKLTVRNSDTGESFEVTLPDGLKNYQINSYWLDSIPYLQEHARHNESWAYKAIGDCFRNGKGVGILSKENMLIVLDFCMENPDYSDSPFTEEGLKRLRMNLDI